MFIRVLWVILFLFCNSCSGEKYFEQHYLNCDWRIPDLFNLDSRSDTELVYTAYADKRFMTIRFSNSTENIFDKKSAIEYKLVGSELNSPYDIKRYKTTLGRLGIEVEIFIVTHPKGSVIFNGLNENEFDVITEKCFSKEPVFESMG